MKALSVFFKDLGAALKNPKVLIPVIAVIFIPIMYSGVYLAAFWDPYGHLDQLPVAVVNKDIGAELEGEKLHVGSDLVDELKKNKDFDWEFVSDKDADKGMKDNHYYMKITIPENFSSQATTLMDDKPQPATITYEPNGDYNFIASQIGTSAMQEIQATIANKVTESYADVLLDGFTDASKGLAEAGDGASKIHDGGSQLDDGAVKLKENLNKLANGTLDAKNGAAPLAKGAGDLNKGAGQLSQGTSQLSSGLDQLNTAEGQLLTGAQQAQQGGKQLQTGLQSSLDGAKKLDTGLQGSEQGASKLEAGLKSSEQGSADLASGLKSSLDGTAQVSEGAKGVADGLQQLAQSSPELAQNPQFQKLMAASQSVAEGSAKVAAGQQKLSDGADSLHGAQQQLLEGASALHSGQQQLIEGSGQLVHGQEQLVQGATKLNDGQSALTAGLTTFGEKLNEAAGGSKALVTGSQQLLSGTSQLEGGASQLTGGLTALADGSQQLNNGAGDLEKGISELNDGSKELSTKLNDAADQTSELKKTDDLVKMFAKPVDSKENESRKVPNYGTGLTPYFMSLGLFVGALISTIVISVRGTTVEGASGFSRFVSRSLSFGGMSLLQSVVAAAIVLLGLGLEVQSVPLFFLFTFITSLAFMFIVQATVTWLDNPGRFLMIILLILQLTTSAGTFPLELIPDWLKPFNPWLPMSHSVIGYKAIISSGDFDLVWKQAGILIIDALIFLSLTLVYFLTRGKKKETNAHPAEAV
ncbi:YhgE/Pip domain-containing protein [Paenibacillus sp. KQZ6P-2]|uniref:YhgE/Pip domain-containing protein n=1 Tax=Paenibacillus mangrovi TaxID=2931978 RepID=A0A9X1WT92_9BACL|nr:YhgE/Pip domain-containing protein [Paenibacillus mangrovi]MCJ8014847.1 YhgE/Pip domain-containing protein [Paenibacillus mangrovi]